MSKALCNLQSLRLLCDREMGMFDEGVRMDEAANDRFWTSGPIMLLIACGVIIAIPTGMLTLALFFCP